MKDWAKPKLGVRPSSRIKCCSHTVERPAESCRRTTTLIKSAEPSLKQLYRNCLTDLYFDLNGVQPSEVEGRIPRKDVQGPSSIATFTQRFPVDADVHSSDRGL